MNSGGSPSGVSAPPIATKIMKKITTWALLERPALARISGRIRIMAAPVVPTKLAIPRTEGENADICAGRAAQIASYEDTASDDVKCDKQHDEAQIFSERGMNQR